MSGGRPRHEARSPLARILANTAWLLGGKGFGAVCGIAYLAILTRSLGLKDFGHFSLIFGTAQALIAIAGFETWRVVVRYGAEHVHARDWDRFGRLGMLCGVIDAVGAVLGCGIAFTVIYGFSDALELNPRYIDTAFWFCCAMLWALVSAPTGIVRALHRFDRAVYVEAVVPLGRLLAALAIWWTGPSVARFLMAWALIDLIDPQDVLDFHVVRVPKAYPAYFGSYDRFNLIRQWSDRINNLYLIGRNGMHRYNNQDHSMLTARVAAEAIRTGQDVRQAKQAIWAVNAEQAYHEEKPQ